MTGLSAYAIALRRQAATEAVLLDVVVGVARGKIQRPVLDLAVGWWRGACVKVDELEAGR